METNFADILNHNADDIKPPPILPQGSYLTVVRGLPEQITSKNGNTGLRFIHQIVAAIDVPEEELAQFENGVAGKTHRHDMWLTEDSIYFENRLKNFLIHCGIDMGGKSLGAGIDEVPNSQVIIIIGHEQSQDGQRMVSKIARTAPADAE